MAHRACKSVYNGPSTRKTRRLAPGKKAAKGGKTSPGQAAVGVGGAVGGPQVTPQGAARAVRAQGGQVHAGFRPLRDRTESAVVVEIGLRIPGVGRVDLDRRIP